LAAIARLNIHLTVAVGIARDFAVRFFNAAEESFATFFGFFIILEI